MTKQVSFDTQLDHVCCYLALDENGANCKEFSYHIFLPFLFQLHAVVAVEILVFQE